MQSFVVNSQDKWKVNHLPDTHLRQHSTLPARRERERERELDKKSVGVQAVGRLISQSLTLVSVNVDEMNTVTTSEDVEIPAGASASRENPRNTSKRSCRVSGKTSQTLQVGIADERKQAHQTTGDKILHENLPLL